MRPHLKHFLTQAGIPAALLMLTLVPAGFFLTLAAASPARAEGASNPLAAASRLTQAGDVAAGARILAARVATRPDDVAAQAYLTMALDRMAAQGDIEGLEGVRQVLPDWPPVLERLGRLYDNQGRHAEAEAVYRSWVTLRPANPEPYARMAEHEVVAGNYPKAVTLFQRHRALVGESDYADRRIAMVRATMQTRGPDGPQALAQVH